MSTDYSKLSFTAGLRYEYITIKGHIDFTMGATYPDNQPTITITHNLGYKPFYKLWIVWPGSSKIRPAILGNSTSSDDWNYEMMNVSNTTTSINVQVINWSGNQVNGTIYYRIYAEAST